jgi:hypothetical protein
MGEKKGNLISVLYPDCACLGHKWDYDYSIATFRRKPSVRRKVRRINTVRSSSCFIRRKKCGIKIPSFV